VNSVVEPICGPVVENGNGTVAGLSSPYRSGYIWHPQSSSRKLFAGILL
jgi:hypothetical protein